MPRKLTPQQKAFRESFPGSKATLHRVINQMRGLHELDLTHQDLRGTSLQKAGEINALIDLPPDEAKRLVEAAKAGEKVSAKQRRLELPLEEWQEIEGLNEINRLLARAHPQVYNAFVCHFIQHLFPEKPVTRP